MASYLLRKRRQRKEGEGGNKDNNKNKEPPLPKRSNKKEKILHRLYYNVSSPSAFTGIQNLRREAKKEDPTITTKDVSDFLHRQETYLYLKPVRRKFPRNRLSTSTLHIDYAWACDLMDVQKIKEHNQGNGFILVVIDRFSRFCFAQPVKNKKPEFVSDAFSRIIKNSGGRTPSFLFSDSGTEFLGKPFQSLLEKHFIIHMRATSSAIKAPQVERVLRVLQGRMWRYFKSQNTYKWTNVLQQLIDGINKTWHSSIKCRPIDVKITNEKEIRNRLKKMMRMGGKKRLVEGKKLRRRKPYRYQLNDIVRLSKEKTPFSKAYRGEDQWTKEKFRIIFRNNAQNPFYLVESVERGDLIRGVFYEPELQPVPSSSI